MFGNLYRQLPHPERADLAGMDVEGREMRERNR
jgi:hypothetical protein